jgi:hypothetical protein
MLESFVGAVVGCLCFPNAVHHNKCPQDKKYKDYFKKFRGYYNKKYDFKWDGKKKGDYKDGKHRKDHGKKDHGKKKWGH